jgi:hypothetical protein
LSDTENRTCCNYYEDNVLLYLIYNLSEGALCKMEHKKRFNSSNDDSWMQNTEDEQRERGME